MTSILSFQLILIILAVCYIDAQLTIFESGLNAGDGSYECGESLVLTCQIGAYSNSMTWQNDSSPTPIAECLQTNCYSDKTTVGLFEFSYDTNSGVFNLTIVQLTLDNNGTIYTCADGSKSSSIAITVEDYQPVVDESTQGKIVVSSGCIDRNTVVRFQFIKIKVDTGEEDGDIQINDVINIVACSEDISCGPNYFVQKTKSINIEPGSDYRLKMILTYDNNHRVESNPTNRKYKIGEPACNTGCTIGIVCAFVGIHILLGCILIYVRAKNRKKRCCTCHCCTWKCVLIVFSAIPLVGIFPVCGWLIYLSYRATLALVNKTSKGFDSDHIRLKTTLEMHSNIQTTGKNESPLEKGNVLRGKSPTEKLSSPKPNTPLPDIRAINDQHKHISVSKKRRENERVDNVLNHKIEAEGEVSNVSPTDVLLDRKEDNENGTDKNAGIYVYSSRQRKPAFTRTSSTQAANKHTFQGHSIVEGQSQTRTSDVNQRRKINSHDTPVQNKITTKQGSEQISDSIEKHSNSTVSGNASQRIEYPEKGKDGTKKQNKNIPVSEGTPTGKINSHDTHVQNKITTKQGSEHKPDSIEKHSNSTVSGNASQGIEYPEKGKDGTKKQNKNIPVSEATPTGKINSHDTPVQNKITTQQGSEHKSDSIEKHSTVSGNASQGIEYPKKGKEGTKKQNKTIPVSDGTTTGKINSHDTPVQNKITTKQGSEHKSDSIGKHFNSTVSCNDSQGIDYLEKGKDETKKKNQTIPVSEGIPTGLETQQTDLSANFTDANDASARVSDVSTNM